VPTARPPQGSERDVLLRLGGALLAVVAAAAAWLVIVLLLRDAVG
jgi:hypothetical protein